MPSHHATFYISTAPWRTLSALEAVLAADPYIVEEDTLRIETVRSLAEMLQRRFASARHVVVVTNMILSPAQNALLKLLEEPPADVYFHFVIPTESFLLPTVKSRILLTAGDAPSVLETNTFFSASYAERLAAVADKVTKKDMSWMQEIARSAAEQAETLEAKQAVRLVSQYYYQSGASRKMLLEHLALSLPLGEN